ncbi:MAG TPA: enoyl-CoA hydratase-related protein [Pseudolabrys sp.]|nr:enoyl-CoA hydratase-related protein [Pseudolabrys sp.]
MPQDKTLSVEGLCFEVDGPVAFLTIENEAEQNRMAPATIAELRRIAAALESRDDLHVVVLRGAGQQYFSTGILNPALRGSMSKEEVIDLVVQARAAFDAIEALPQIIIAGLNGEVRAGGVELALACDIRIAAEHVRLSLPEAQWGGFPGAGGPLRLARLIGRPRALDLICTGRAIDAREMERMGIVQKVVAAREFERSLHEFVTQVASSGPLALRGAKEIMMVSEKPGFEAAREKADALRQQLEWSTDVDEGIRAHQEGRRPRFTGR